jgi:hypothetical protein
MNLNDGIAARRTGSIALLTAAVMLFSFALACATPFPAIAALAALHLRSSDALALTGIRRWFLDEAHRRA